jgi:hypothetical protein
MTVRFIAVLTAKEPPRIGCVNEDCHLIPAERLDGGMEEVRVECSTSGAWIHEGRLRHGVVSAFKPKPDKIANVGIDVSRVEPLIA